MSPVTSPLTDFERNARAVLEESVARIDARTRSRLNQARQLAVDSAGPRHRRWWRTFAFMPAGAALHITVLAPIISSGMLRAHLAMRDAHSQHET